MITTEAFVGLARTEATAFGMPDVRMIVIPHPLAGTTGEALNRYAEIAIAQILGLLGAK